MNNILITGAASGIGAATARLFHARGWQVGLLDMDGVALASLAEELGGAWQRTLDVTDVAAASQAIDDFCALQQGRLRLLFNCAGILHTGAFEQIALQEHLRLLQINVLGLLTCTHLAFPYLKAMPDAQVLNMGSASGLYGVPLMASYSASKFAVRGLTEALELEWRAHGIRVGDLMPPFVNTPMLAGQAWRPSIVRRLGVRLMAEHIAEAAWQQAQVNRVHRPIGLQFRLLHGIGQITPAFITRALMAWLSRP